MIDLLVYQIRAVWQFCTDNNLTPYVIVNTNYDDTIQVPKQYITKEGTITLNLSINATSRLDIGDEIVSLSARFNGKSFDIFFPVNSIIAIYSKETLEGIQIGFRQKGDKPPKIERQILEAKPETKEEEQPPLGDNIVRLDSFRSKSKTK
jgi:stringent starvation protein B